MNGKYNAQTNKFVLAIYNIKVYATRGNYFVIPRVIGKLINDILAGYYKTNDSIMWAENIINKNLMLLLLCEFGNSKTVDQSLLPVLMKTFMKLLTAEN